MQNQDSLPALSELEDWQLVNKDQDLRGRPLLTHSGQSIGTVKRMLVDRSRERIAAVVLDNGRTVRIEDVEIRGGSAYIDEDMDVPPAMMSGARATSDTDMEERIPIAEEELVVGKREVERGHIHVRSHVIERPVHEEVRLRDEHVDVERRPVDGGPVRDTEGLFQDRTIEMVEHDEEAVVAKEARVVEEVVVRKDQTERVEEIDDTVRRTEVDIDENGEGFDRRDR